ncbi:MAG: T6SS phospholipase effector Tle1-like catalytic domain-containing protein [Telluria sp.]
MSSMLSPQCGHEFGDATNLGKFFGDDVTKVQTFEKREQPPICVPKESCSSNLFFGFFFDGTKNNYVEAEAGKNHSNVARLYDCYPGLSVPGVLPRAADWKNEPERYSHFFKVYVPGVASKFAQVGDTGEGNDLNFGAAAGALAERRIIWALLQAINNVHRYLLKTPLISQEEAHGLARKIFLNKQARALMQGDGSPKGRGDMANLGARRAFEELLRRLHRAVSAHWPNEKTGKPAKIDPGIVKTIYISVFGFSRGATQARAFLNWLQSLGKLDAQLRGKVGGMSLGGFPVVIEFLGLFDTVASVGSANTFGVLHGHGAWADTEDSLRVPPDVKCLHLVAAHELRRSFPVDAVSVKGVLPDSCREVVVPGVHSDVGCGYCPCEQGRGTDPNGADMLARIPLIMMYKEARLSGVPLKLELASPVAKARFMLKPETIKAFNAYIAECKATQGPIHTIMREQARKQIEWRLARRTSGSSPLQKSASFIRAATFDQNDLHSAGLEFEEEVKSFLEWMKDEGRTFRPARQKAGFDNDHSAEWEEIATWWGKVQPPSAAVMDFFDNYVHDSRAWFKIDPSSPSSEEEMRAQLGKWVQQVKDAKSYNESRSIIHGRGTNPHRRPVVTDGLTEDQRRAADEYARTGKIPRLITSGREPHQLGIAGYLRFRKIYGGFDAVLLSAVSPAQGAGRVAAVIPPDQSTSALG